MIKKRLFSLVKEAGRYILLNVFWQWIALCSAILAAFATGGMIEEVLEKRTAGGLLILCALALSLFLRGISLKMAAKASSLASQDVKKSLRLKLYE